MKIFITEENIRFINQKIGKVLALKEINKKNLEELNLKGTEASISVFKDENIISIARVFKSFIREEPYTNYKTFEEEFNKKTMTQGLGDNALKVFEKTGLDEIFI